VVNQVQLIYYVVMIKKAEVSDKPQSCTTKVLEYNHNSNENIILIDTVGYEDSSGISDEVIMKDILVTLCVKKIKQVYIIWCIKPSDRATSPLQKQAQFINLFKQNEIWKSTIILVKEGTPMIASKQISGVIEAANIKGNQNNNYDIPCLLYSCVDWFNEEHKNQHDAMEYTVNQKEKNGYLTSNEVKLKIEEAIKKLSGPTQIIFKIQQCKKCNAIGDERCMEYTQCHLKEESYHPLQNEIIHNELLNNYHGQELKNIIEEEYKNRNISVKELNLFIKDLENVM